MPIDARQVANPSPCPLCPESHDELAALLARSDLRRVSNSDLLSELEYLEYQRAELVATGEPPGQYASYLARRINVVARELKRREDLAKYGAPKLPSRGLISPELVARIKAAVDLADLIGRDIQVSAYTAGRWRGRCPVHGDGSDRDPSLVIYPDQRWHCFGCNGGGDCFEWLRAYHHLSFPQAVKYAANFARISLAEVNKDGHPR